MKGLRNELGLLQVFCVSIGAMISSGLFVLPALAYGKTGTGIILAYGLAALLVFPTVLAKSELVSALPRAGGIFVFADRSMGPWVGMVAGLSAWFSLSFKTAFALLGMGIFVSLVFPESSSWTLKGVSVFFCLLFAFVNLHAVKLTGRIQTLLVLLLLGILSLFIIVGGFQVNPAHLSGWIPNGWNGLLGTVGMIIISFSGTTKIAAIAEEVKNPEKNIPLGMFLSWFIGSLFYLAALTVLVGISGGEIGKDLTPFSTAGGLIMGPGGMLLMTFAALLAFITTANAGILAASRDPMAMARDDLLPKAFSHLSKVGVPHFSIFCTVIFILSVILFLDLEAFVKTASTLKLLLFTIVNLALLLLRFKANPRHYKPKFRAPLFPWAQLIAIPTYLFLMLEMGALPLTLAILFVLFSLGFYALYAKRRIDREYALLHSIRRIADIRYKDYIFFEESRELLRAQDKQAERIFEQRLKQAALLDYRHPPSMRRLSRDLAQTISQRLGVPFREVYLRLIHKEHRQNLIAVRGVAVMFLHVKEANRFDLALMRSQEGFWINRKLGPLQGVILMAASHDHESLYLHALDWILLMLEQKHMGRHWKKAANAAELHETLLSAWVKGGDPLQARGWRGLPGAPESAILP